MAVSIKNSYDEILSKYTQKRVANVARSEQTLAIEGKND